MSYTQKQLQARIDGEKGWQEKIKAEYRAFNEYIKTHEERNNPKYAEYFKRKAVQKWQEIHISQGKIEAFEEILEDS